MHEWMMAFLRNFFFIHEHYEYLQQIISGDSTIQ